MVQIYLLLTLKNQQVEISWLTLAPQGNSHRAYAIVTETEATFSILEEGISDAQE